MCRAVFLMFTEETQEANDRAASKWDFVLAVNDFMNVGKRIDKQQWIDQGEDPAKFPGRHLIINMPGVNPAKLDPLKKQEFLTASVDPLANLMKYRTRKLDYEGLKAVIPQAMKDKIIADQQITLTTAQIQIAKTFFVEKIGGSIVDVGI